MSNNFGTGQGTFGAPFNQNKNQTTSIPGSAPAPGASPFANLGANTTNSPVFGGMGAGAGNTPGSGGTTSVPTGGIFGTGSGAFGGSANTSTNAATPTPAGAGAGAGTASPFGGSFLGGMFASYSVLLELSHLKDYLAKPATTTGPAGPATGNVLFPNASSNTGMSGTTPGQSPFGNTTSMNTGTTGGTREPTAHHSVFGNGLLLCLFQLPCLISPNLRPPAGAPSVQGLQVPLALVEAVQLVVAYSLVQRM